MLICAKGTYYQYFTSKLCLITSRFLELYKKFCQLNWQLRAFLVRCHVDLWCYMNTWVPSTIHEIIMYRPYWERRAVVGRTETVLLFWFKIVQVYVPIFLLSCHLKICTPNSARFGLREARHGTLDRRGARRARVSAQSERWPIIGPYAASAPRRDQRDQLTGVWLTSRGRPALRRAFANHFPRYCSQHRHLYQPSQSVLSKVCVRVLKLVALYVSQRLPYYWGYSYLYQYDILA